MKLKLNPAQWFLRGLLRFYQRLVSPLLVGVFGPAGFGCRFQPTCSQYALEAVIQHGALAGSWLAARRLCRCHPWGGQGPDPVPPRRSSSLPAPPSSRLRSTPSP